MRSWFRAGRGDHGAILCLSGSPAEAANTGEKTGATLMKTRMNIANAAPEAYASVLALNDYVVNQANLPANLLYLIKLRASQINGCAYCVDMHTKEARHAGMGEQWLALISTWQESPIYSDVERAVLGWTEALTRLADTRAPDADYAPLKSHFSDEEIGNITVAIGLINVWNRIAVGLRTQHPVDRPRTQRNG
jgi:AhpD family alkylhydroperoxidase